MKKVYQLSRIILFIFLFIPTFSYAQFGAPIFGKAFMDLNCDGISQSGESGISGITVQVLNFSNTVVATTFTDMTGNYTFTSLMTNNYKVRFLLGSASPNTFHSLGSNSIYTVDNAGIPNKTATSTMFMNMAPPPPALVTPIVRNIGISNGTCAPLVVPPTIQASNAVCTTPGYYNMNVTWTRGNGSSVIVLCKEATAVNANPVSGTSYSPASIFGFGSQIGSGNYVVYMGTGTSVTISDLIPEKTYHVAVYEYNGMGSTTVFNTTLPARANAKAQMLTSPIPGTAVWLNGVNHYFSDWSGALPYKPIHSTANFTIEMWLKLTDYQFNGLQTIMASTNVATDYGVNFAYDNRSSLSRSGQLLLEIYNGTGTPLVSSLSPANSISDNEWHHIAVTAAGVGSTPVFYVDGNPYTGTGTIGSSLSSVDPTRYMFYGACPTGYQAASNNYTGATNYLSATIDEFRFWDASKSTTEIRANKNLIMKGIEPNLIRYFQFNEAIGSGDMFKSIANTRSYPASFNTGIDTYNPAVEPRVPSGIAVARGISNAQTVNAGGLYTFTGTGMRLTFPASGTYPSGTLVVSRLDTLPLFLPAGVTTSNASRYIWVVDNYGTNKTFSPLTQLYVEGFGVITGAQQAAPASNFVLYKRPTNASEQSSWVSYGGAFAASSGLQSITFTDANNITSFSQVLPVATPDPLPVTLLDFTARKSGEANVTLEWTVEQEQEVSYYLPEYSLDGKTFIPLEEVKATGKTNYSAIVTQEASLVYYRLKWRNVESDAYEYSKVVTVVKEGSKSYVVPTLAENGSDLKIIHESPEPLLKVLITNSQGGILQEYSIEGKEFSHTIPLQGYLPGVYFAKLIFHQHTELCKFLIY